MTTKADTTKEGEEALEAAPTNLQEFRLTAARILDQLEYTASRFDCCRHKIMTLIDDCWNIAELSGFTKAIELRKARGINTKIYSQSELDERLVRAWFYGWSARDRDEEEQQKQQQQQQQAKESRRLPK